MPAKKKVTPKKEASPKASDESVEEKIADLGREIEGDSEEIVQLAEGATKLEEVDEKPKEAEHEEYVKATEESPEDEQKEEKEEEKSEEEDTKSGNVQSASDSNGETEGRGDDKPWGDVPSDNGSHNIMIFIVVVLITIVVAGGGYFFLNSMGSKFFSKPTPTPAPTKAPTPTAAAVDKSEYQIEVLNGSGVAGAAAEAQEMLEDEGFTVESIGNADESDLVETEIAAQEDVSKNYLNELVQALAQQYIVATGINELDGSEDVDVIVTVGSGSSGEEDSE
jgi:hypothetical protein